MMTLNEQKLFILKEISLSVVNVQLCVCTSVHIWPIDAFMYKCMCKCVSLCVFKFTLNRGAAHVH